MASGGRTKLGGKKSAGASAKKKKSSGKKGSGKKGKKSAKSKTPKSEPVEIDMMSAPAMENLYYIAHASPDALTLRGFKWEGAPTGKKKGKKKKMMETYIKLGRNFVFNDKFLRYHALICNSGHKHTDKGTHAKGLTYTNGSDYFKHDSTDCTAQEQKTSRIII